jgi:hypothetical protein
LLCGAAGVPDHARSMPEPALVADLIANSFILE